MVESHLSADDVAAMVDGQLSGNPRSRVEKHLALCAQCRAELASVSALVASAPSASVRRVRRSVVVRAVAVAAAIALMVMPSAMRRDGSQRSAEREQRGTSAAVATAVVSPEPSVAVDRNSARFVWHSDGKSTYRLFVTDSAGAQLFTTTTTDTSVITPDTVRLVAGAHYFWFVDVLRGDGSSASSPPTKFSIRR